MRSWTDRDDTVVGDISPTLLSTAAQEGMANALYEAEQEVSRLSRVARQTAKELEKERSAKHTALRDYARLEKKLTESEFKRGVLEGALQNLTRERMARIAATPDNMAVLAELNQNRDNNLKEKR